MTFSCFLQGPPGTGKTSAIVAIISALLAKHYIPVNPKAKQPLPGPSSNSPPSDAPDPVSSSLLPPTNPKQLLPGPIRSSASVTAKNAMSSSSGQGQGRAGPVIASITAPAPAPKFRILVCAQSNAPIDEVIARLASPGLLMGEPNPT